LRLLLLKSKHLIFSVVAYNKPNFFGLWSLVFDFLRRSLVDATTEQRPKSKDLKPKTELFRGARNQRFADTFFDGVAIRAGYLLVD
jgi:hypothetical protein